MATLFETTRLKSVELGNRLVRSATHEGLADEQGAPSDRLFELYGRLARGGVGLIITGYASVSPEGASPYPGQLAMDRDDLVPRFRALVEHVHAQGARIALQLAHCGRQTRPEVTGHPAIAPSPVRNGMLSGVPQQMSEADMERVLQAFAQAARRAREAGFDAVQLHGAHGYLINQFLCPHTNRRTDCWGGSLEDRMRFVVELYDRCRAAVGPDYPLLIKINVEDRMSGGLRLDEGVEIAVQLGALGFDALELSCGISEDGISTMRGDLPVDVFLSEWDEFRSAPWWLRLFVRWFGRWWFRPPPMIQAFNRPAAARIRQRSRVPLLLVGGLTDPAAMEQIVQSGDADYISLCRALVAEPHFPRTLRDGRREPSKCIHCNLCLAYISTAPLRCYRGKRREPTAPERQLEGGARAG